jgi:hypothetical protein
MKTKKSVCMIMILSVLLVAASSAAISAEQPKSSLNGLWAVKYADNSEGTLTVEKNTLKLTIPAVGEIKGMVQESGTYFESILSDRREGVNFIFGYLKGGKLEGKLQERAPCPELKKAFKSGVVVINTSCQFPFTAVKK